MSTVRFLSVTVREAPGFDGDYRPKLENLGPAFNLVLAPNAAGKSTLARAMRGLIWPKTEGLPDVEAEVEIGEETLRVRTVRGNSVADPFSPGCAPAAYHDFRLSDLLQPEGRTEQEMALQAEQATKGYRREAIARIFDGRIESLRLLGGPATLLPRRAQEEYRDAYERLEEIRAAARAQNDLDLRLAREREELEALVPADEIAREGASFEAYLQARDRVSESLETLGGIEKRAVLFAPGDLGRRRRLVADLDEAENTLRQNESRVDRLRRERGDRPGRILTREEKAELTDRTAAARTARLALDRAEDELRSEESRVASTVAAVLALPGVPEGYDPLAAARAVRDRLGEIEDRSERWMLAEARAAAFGELEANRPANPAEPEKAAAPPQPPSTEARERILASWETATGGPDSGALLLLGAVGLGVVSAFLPESIRLVVVALAVVVGIFGFLQSRKPATAKPDTELLRNAIRTEIEEWRAYCTAVAGSESRAEAAKRSAEETARAKAWWEGVERAYTKDREAAAAAPDQRAALAAALGLPGGTRALTLTLAYRIVDSLATAERDLAARRAAWTSARARFEELWALALSSVQRSGGDAAENADDLVRIASGLVDLSNREENLRSAEKDLEIEKERRDRLREELSALYRDRELETEDAELFESLAQAADARREALAALADRRESHRRELRRLIASGSFERFRTDGFFDLACLRQAVSTNAEAVSVRRAEMAERQERVRAYADELEKARATDNQERADAELGEARERLEASREAVAEAAAGSELLAWLDESVRRTDLPEVLKGANELLDRAVPGLSLAAENGRLVAYEGLRKKEMGQLSDGTRVQAILAARLGFLKHQEEGRTRAPLFLDETLANSDVQRAASVMRMVLELCREGRQIFYFSNQAGEAARWRDVAFSLDPDLFRVHPLDMPGRPRLRLPDEPGDPEYLAGLPEPSLGFAAYLEALVLSPCDPWAPNLDDLPLAWLCAPDELPHLDGAMRNRRETLGRLLAKPGAYDPVWVSRVRARAAYLEELRRLWCTGRTRPWRRSELDRFERKGLREEGRRFVASVLESPEVDGDPVRLHRNLRMLRKIDGWGNETREEFLAWLGDQLPTSEALSRPEAEAQARSLARRHLRPEGPLTDEDLDRLGDLLTWPARAPG